MRKNRSFKIFWPLLSITSLPAIALVACGGQKDSNGEDPEQQNSVVIDLDATSSVKEVFTQLDQNFKIFMPKRGDQMMTLLTNAQDNEKYVSEEDFAVLKDYLDKINFGKTNLVLKSGGKSANFDFTKVAEALKKVQKEVGLGYGAVKTKAEVNQIILQTQNEPANNLTAVTSHAIGLTLAVRLASFASIPGQGFTYYNDMLQEYHNLSHTISQSQIWQNWVNGKQYTLVKSSNTEADPEVISVSPGDLYDQGEKIEFIAPKPKDQAQLNNWEAQLVLSILKFV